MSRTVKYKRKKVEEKPYCDDGCGRLYASGKGDDPYAVAEVHAKSNGHVTFVRVVHEHSYWPEDWE